MKNVSQGSLKLGAEGPAEEDQATQGSSRSLEEGYSPIDSDTAHGSLCHQMSGGRGSWQGVGTHAAELIWDQSAPGFTSGELRSALTL